MVCYASSRKRDDREEEVSEIFHVVDTIVAQATPSGRGGIAVVRVSGPQVTNVIHHVLGHELSPRQAAYHRFYDVDGAVIDEGIAIFFSRPNSFTGEDVLELHGHGGPVVVDLLLQRILSLGPRLARPGEFSERAYLNGKIDLAQAESIADLINASSQQAARSAIRSLQGEFSKEIYALNEKIIYLRTYIEAAIDFTDEEIDFLGDEKIATLLSKILEDLNTIQQKAKQGSFLREGITVVIVGEPNVGKSSLLNYLSGKEVAIVTDIPGTTRDVLRNDILIDGMPIHIIDTAGLRHSDDLVEQEGIRRAYHEMEKADIILHVVDAANAVSSDMTRWENSRPRITIRNKIDLTREQPSIKNENSETIISLSVKLGVGIDLLKSHIKAQVGYCPTTEGTYLARRRHLDALARAKTHLQESLMQLRQSHAGELAAEDLRLAHLSLCEITGEFTTDDLLGHIFSSFCIGK
ncbi:MAG: tRNA uridine-5-carboxymethylaminomethyl(34) synthesis GTPase MnmE [Gammaproteobacteria bacterium]|nr:tRNA uridine-5-carboxymethylaminomethyl(34) synthesis GTPase MnmE [Gammaproteobacteria bacterium]MCW5582870.1 tRNA uridine-5-carboxymethylaminomethyl(34) synthesis GTPase MnmE [Gammaproteobacteria bacterium]